MLQAFGLTEEWGLGNKLSIETALALMGTLIQQPKSQALGEECALGKLPALGCLCLSPIWSIARDVFTTIREIQRKICILLAVAVPKLPIGCSIGTDPPLVVELALLSMKAISKLARIRG